jgi:Fur family transcriptional regulator, ferric uptake regulator
MLPDHVRELMKRLGLRATYPRSLVIEALLALDRPVSHQELAEQLPASDIDLSTVFRNLVLLVETGLVRRIELGDRIWRYEWVGVQGAVGNHPHFVCSRCVRILCLNDGGPANPPPTPAGLLVEEIVLRGLCPECRTQPTPGLD